MAFVDDPNKNLNTENQVAGAAPLSNATSQAVSEPSQDSSPQVSSSSSSTPTAKIGASGSNKRASSGMFTNIQNYINKNQSQASKMADQSLANVKKAGDDIKKKQQESIQQFTSQAQSSGLHDTQARVQELSDFTTTEANAQQASQNETDQSADRTAGLAESNLTLGTTPVSTTNISEDQFANIINAKYGGPRGLADTGAIYQGLSKQAEESGRIGDLAQSVEGRRQLLKDDFTKKGRRYSEGSSKLDNLLLGQQSEGIQQIQDAAQGIGSKSDILRDISNQAQQIAADTSSAVDATREQSRQSFQDISGARKDEVDQRINAVIENWDELPSHFRDAISNPDGTVNLSALEAATLGVQSGEGLYNLSGEDLFGTAEDPAVMAERDRLISTNEQFNLDRLNALSQLAQGEDKLFDIGDYFDSTKAGTQSAFDALNVDGVRDQLANAEQLFRTEASQDVTGQGSGSAKYDKGWLRGKGKVRRSATETGNLKDILQSQGYNFDEEIQTESTANSDILKALSDVSKYSSGEVEDTTGEESTLDTMAGLAGEDAAHWSAIGDALGIENLGKYMNMGGWVTGTNELTENVGKEIQAGTESLENSIFGGDNNFIGNSLTDPVNVIGKGIEDIGRELGNLTNSIFGGGKTKAKAEAKKEAQENALKDLQNRLTSQLTNSGFDNRLNVTSDEETQQRDNNLMDLLRRLDDTNK